MDDGRELPLYKLETPSESHPFYTGTQKSVDRSAAASRSSATSSRTSASRSEAGLASTEKAASAAFFARAPEQQARCLAASCARHDRRRVNQPDPGPRHAATPRAACRGSRCCCSARPTCCPAWSAATRGRTPTSPRSATCVEHGAGPASLAGARRGRRAGRSRAAAVLARRRVIHAAPLARSGARRAHPVRAAAGAARWRSPGTRPFHLARTEAAQPLPFAFGGEASPSTTRAPSPTAPCSR